MIVQHWVLTYFARVVFGLGFWTNGGGFGFFEKLLLY